MPTRVPSARACRGARAVCLTIAGTALLGSAAFMALPIGAASAGTTSPGDAAGETPLSLVDTVGTALAGKATPVSLTVTDRGPEPETDIRITETLPVGVSYVANSSTPASVGAPKVAKSPAPPPITAVAMLSEEAAAARPTSVEKQSQLTWSPAGTLDPGASVTVHFAVEAAGAAGVSFLQSATATAVDGGTSAVEAFSSSSFDLRSLAVQETSSGPPAPSGSKATSGIVTETVTVADSPTVTAAGLDVDVYLPAGVTLASCASVGAAAAGPACEAPTEQSSVDLALRAGVDAPAYPIGAGGVAFTRVQWTLPGLAAGATEAFRYAADVPVTAQAQAPADLVVLSATVAPSAAEAPAPQPISEPLQPVSPSTTSVPPATSSVTSATSSVTVPGGGPTDVASTPNDAPQTTGIPPAAEVSTPPVSPISTIASGTAPSLQPTAAEAAVLHVFTEAPPPLSVHVEKLSVHVQKTTVAAPATRAKAAAARVSTPATTHRAEPTRPVAKERAATTAATKAHATKAHATKAPAAAAHRPAATPKAESGTNRDPFTGGSGVATSSSRASDPKPLAMTGADSERELDVVLGLALAGTSLLASSRFRTKRQRRKRGRLLAERWLLCVLNPTVAS